MPDQDVVVADQGNHIGRSSQNDEIQVPLEVGLLALGPPTPIPTMCTECATEIKRKPATTKLFEPAGAIRTLGIDDRDRGRKTLGRVDLVVIHDEQIDSELFCPESGSVARDPAVYRHKQADPRRMRFVHSGDSEAITIFESIRLPNIEFKTAVLEKPAQKCGPSSPVHIVITEDPELLSLGARLLQALNSEPHVGDEERVLERLDARMQEVLDRLRVS